MSTPLSGPHEERSLGQRALRVGIWSLPFATPAVVYLLVAELTPLFSCGCMLTKFLVVFAGAYLGIVAANYLSARLGGRGE